MINVEEVKIQILKTLDMVGPSLPIQIAKTTGLSPMFASAILSELVGAQKVKMSKLKYGSTPLYLIPGQEQRLENFADENLSAGEKIAYHRLKEEKIIDDIKQEPAMRVALRSINDFAVPIRFQDKIIWKYKFITNEEAKDILDQKFNGKEKPAIKIEKEQERVEQEPEVKEEIVIERQKVKLIPKEEESEEPVEPKAKPPKTKKKFETVNEFLVEVKSFLDKKDIELVKEIESKKKDVTAIIRINSDLGKISFLLIAKDKKKLNLTDLTMAYQKAITHKMPCYLLSRSESSKAIEGFLEEHKNLLKLGHF